MVQPRRRSQRSQVRSRRALRRPRAREERLSAMGSEEGACLGANVARVLHDERSPDELQEAGSRLYVGMTADGGQGSEHREHIVTRLPYMVK